MLAGAMALYLERHSVLLSQLVWWDLGMVQLLWPNKRPLLLVPNP